MWACKPAALNSWGIAWTGLNPPGSYHIFMFIYICCPDSWMWSPPASAFDAGGFWASAHGCASWSQPSALLLFWRNAISSSIVSRKGRKENVLIDRKKPSPTRVQEELIVCERKSLRLAAPWWAFPQLQNGSKEGHHDPLPIYPSAGERVKWLHRGTLWCAFSQKTIWNCCIFARVCFWFMIF